jgi:hypothetical protein
MTLLTLVVVIAGGLVVESLRIFAATGRELREPASELALRTLREDIRSSLPIGAGSGELLCRRTDRSDRWVLRGDRIERDGFDAFGGPTGTRPMIDRVVSFRWEALPGGVVVATVVRRRPDGSSAMRAGTAVWRPDGQTLESATVIAASRLGGS